MKDLEDISNKLLQMLEEGKQELISKRKKNSTSSSVIKESYTANKEHNEDNAVDQAQVSGENVVGVPNIANLDITSDESLTTKNHEKEFGKKVIRRAVKKVIVSEESGEGLYNLATGNPTEVVLELVLGSIGEQLGLQGTKGFYAAALTHYAIGQFVVLIGITTSPIKMDFSGITQAKILKKLEDLNKKVDKIIASPSKQALQHLKEGLMEMKHGGFKEAYNKFTEVTKFAKEAISLAPDFPSLAVCTKYLVFADTMAQAFTSELLDPNGKTHGPGFLPVESLPANKKQRMASYLSSVIDDLKKGAKTKGKKKDEHRDKIDDVLKMVYNIISVSKDLSNPNTVIKESVTFGVDSDFIPFGEEDATALQVGRYVKDQEVSDADIKDVPPYFVYLWRSDNLLHVRRERKFFDIPLRKVSGSIVIVKLEQKGERLVCNFGENKNHFEMTADSSAGYPTNIQEMSTLFETVKVAKDMDSLPMPTYAQMQKIPEVYLADLGIDVNEKNEDKTLLHNVACLKSGWSNKTKPIDCLVDAGADLGMGDSKGRTPLMVAMLKGDLLKENIKTLINHYEGTPELNAVDNDGCNILHLAASIRETSFTKDMIKQLLHVKADATHFNTKQFNPKDMAHLHQNWATKKILQDWMTGK
eukprot:GFUD01007672.1.p1 GENE.GFUD01007672.1~~GFUD01007672.1.p1  ORF type:complete len:707 (+),score=179.53 GFUD01007672.1:190-2121(+)